MKKFILAATLSLIVGSAITLTSCTKKTEAAPSDDSVSAQDVNSVSNGVNATTDDAASAAGQVKSFSGKTEGAGALAVLCGVSIVDTGTAGNRVITITYDGTTTCNGVLRSGSISIVNNSGIPWSDAGSVITVTYNNLKLTDVVSMHSYTITGTHTLTKETSGLAWQILYGTLTNATVTRRNVSTNMEITFDNGETRKWTVDRTRSWNSTVTGNSNLITVSIYSEAAGNVDVTGTNRYGTTFTNTINTTIMANSQTGCLFRPYQGEVTHSIANRVVTVQYGTNPQGGAMGSATTCGDGYFITYYKNGNVKSTRFVYYW